MILAGIGPVCTQGDEFDTLFDGEAEELGEAEVVADGGGAPDGGFFVPGKCHYFFTICKRVGLAAVGEGVDFGVGTEREALGVDDAHDIEGVGFSGGQDCASALDGDCESFCQVGEVGLGIFVCVVGCCDVE